MDMFSLHPIQLHFVYWLSEDFSKLTLGETCNVVINLTELVIQCQVDIAVRDNAQRLYALKLKLVGRGDAQIFYLKLKLVIQIDYYCNF